MLFTLIVIIAGYAVGTISIFTLKLIGVAFVFSKAVLLMLTLPLICVCVTEAFTLLWSSTPGSIGLGGLNVFIPVLISGLFNAAVALAAQKWMLPFDLSSGVRNSENLTEWLILSIICCVTTLGLWRFWPAPTARLW